MPHLRDIARFFCYITNLSATTSAAALAVALAVAAAAAIAALTVAAALVVAAATAAMARRNLLGSGVAHLKDGALEADILASERVVEVHLDILVGDLEHDAVDAIAVGGHHRQDGALGDSLVVKLAVNLKDVAWQLGNLLVVIGAECIGGLDDEVEGRTLLQPVNGLLEGNYHAAGDTEDNLLGVIDIGLMDEFLTFGSDFIEVITEFYVFSWLNFFHK